MAIRTRLHLRLHMSWSVTGQARGFMETHHLGCCWKRVRLSSAPASHPGRVKCSMACASAGQKERLHLAKKTLETWREGVRHGRKQMYLSWLWY